ncbi:hypothetical protein [Aeromonas enterica]
MITNGELQDSLTNTSRHYTTIKTKFTDFVGFLESSFKQPNFSVSGVSVTQCIDENRVDINYVGKTFRLVFSVAITGDKNLTVGVICCYLLVEHPEQKLVETGRFTFKQNGQSDLIDPEDNSPLNITDAWSVRYIGMHLIHEALKQCHMEDKLCTTN